MAGIEASDARPTAPAESITHDTVVAVCENHARAEEAGRELRKAGFDMKRLSLVGKRDPTEEGVDGFYNAGDRMNAWRKARGVPGWTLGMLFGLALFVMPRVGPLFAAGPLVPWVIGGLEGAAILGGTSALEAGLYSIGTSTGVSSVTRRISQPDNSSSTRMAFLRKSREDRPVVSGAATYDGLPASNRFA